MLRKIFKKQTALDKQIEMVIKSLSECEPGSEEYMNIIEVLDKLYKMKSQDDKGVSMDTLLIVGGNLLGIVLILGYEKAGTITSKALNLIIKGRV